MYCPDKHYCVITACGGDRCVGAKVVYNGMEYGEEQKWISPPALGLGPVSKRFSLNTYNSSSRTKQNWIK